MKIAFAVLGKPQPAGSKRAFPFQKATGQLGVRVTDANPKSRDWKAAVAYEARQSYDGPLIEGPLLVDMTFYRQRPKGHFGKKGVKSSAPDYPTTKPDVLKLARGVEDALTGVIWRDDAQIVSETITKEYGEPERVEIVIQLMMTIDSQPTEEAKG